MYAKRGSVHYTVVQQYCRRKYYALWTAKMRTGSPTLLPLVVLMHGLPATEPDELCCCAATAFAFIPKALSGTLHTIARAYISIDGAGTTPMLKLSKGKFP